MARPLTLFLLCMFAYNLNLRRSGSNDSVPALLLPFSIVLDHSLTLDRFSPWLDKTWPPETQPYFIHREHGHIYSRYPVALPVLISPAYLPVVAVLRVRTWPAERLVSLAMALDKLVAAAIAALSVVACLFLFRQMTTESIAWILTLLYAFATSIWSIASQSLYQHGAGMLCIALGLFFLKRAPENLLYAGLWAGLSAAIRPNNAIFVVSILLYLAFRRVSLANLARFAVFPAIFVSLAIVYNRTVYHNSLGWYGTSAHFHLSTLPVGLVGTLVSPNRGLFVYSPIFLFSLVGLYLWWRSGQLWKSAPLGVSVIFVALHLVVIGSYFEWWGGWTYGPRYMLESVPCLLLFMIPAIEWIARRPVWKGAFVAAVAVSVAVQIIGFACYPNGNWDSTPYNVDRYPERLWDYKDNQIMRTLHAGPILTGYRKLGLIDSGKQ